MSGYVQMIQGDIDSMGLTEQVDPRHVEAWMRLEFGTLSHLERVTFHQYIKIDMSEGPKAGEDLALTYGL